MSERRRIYWRKYEVGQGRVMADYERPLQRSVQAGVTVQGQWPDRATILGVESPRFRCRGVPCSWLHRSLSFEVSVVLGKLAPGADPLPIHQILTQRQSPSGLAFWQRRVRRAKFLKR